MIAAYQAAAPEGDVSRAAHRAQLAVALALGHLAARDDRALDDLVALATRGPAPVAWRFGRFDAMKIDRLRRELAVTGLALSGRAHAGAVLNALAGRAGGRPSDLAAHAEGMIDVHAARAAARRAR